MVFTLWPANCKMYLLSICHSNGKRIKRVEDKYNSHHIAVLIYIYLYLYFCIFVILKFV